MLRELLPLGRRREDEAAPLEALRVQRKPRLIPDENLYVVPGSSVIPHTDLVPSLLSIAGIRCTGSECRCSVV